MRKVQDIKSYELSFITAPDISENESEKVVNEMREIIAKHEGTDVHYESWGTKTSNYPIKKRTKLNYHCLFFKGGKVNEISKVLQYKTALLRFMCVKAKGTICSAQALTPLAQSLANKNEADEI